MNWPFARRRVVFSVDSSVVQWLLDFIETIFKENPRTAAVAVVSVLLGSALGLWIAHKVRRWRRSFKLGQRAHLKTAIRRKSEIPPAGRVPEPPPLSAVEAAAIQALRDGNDELRRELREERAKASDLRMLLQQAQDAQAAAQAECLRAREEAEYQRAEAQQQIERLKTDFLALWSQLETRVDEQDALRARADELERKLKQADETRQQLEEQKLRLAEDFLRALRDWFHSYPSGELEAVSQAAVAASARGVLDRQLAESELVELARRLKMGPATTKSAALDALVAWLVDRQ